jgi:hypothetical protein
LDNNRPSINHLLFFLSAIVLVLGIYSYPALRTTRATSSRALPPISAPDLSLYLNISEIKTTSDGQVIDPYYGVPVPSARMGYLKFRLAFILFERLHRLLHANLWWTLFLWNLFWWGFLCALAVWFFQQFLPDPSPVVVLAGIAFLMFFNFGILQSEFAAWAHLFSWRGFQSVELAYIRPFFPQIPIPLLVLYLGLQIKALEKRSGWLWAAMAATQFVAFVIFPYAMLMMAGITAVAVFGQLISKREQTAWLTVAGYALVCGVADMLFFFHGSQIARTGAPGQYALVHLDLSMLPHRIGGMWLVLAALTALMFVIRDLAPEIKWTLVGLGLTNLFLLVGDAFFSETALQMSHHGGYFVHLTAAILFVFLLSAGFRYWTNWKPALRIVMGAITALLVVNGFLIAHATYQVTLSTYEVQAELAQSLKADPPLATDLVIARSLFVDDDCALVPLLSNSHSLFCRNAQVLLSPEQNQQIQRFRQALYLYFTNRDDRWVEHILDDPNAMSELTRLMFLGQVEANAEDRQRGVESVRQELIPLLIKVQNHDPVVRSFFAQYRRVMVIDHVADPYFSTQRLSAYLKIERQQTVGKLLILDCAPLDH